MDVTEDPNSLRPWAKSLDHNRPDVAATELWAGPELSVIAPTFNEVDNVAELIRRLKQTLNGIFWEIIFVDDDSPDGTAEKVRALARTDRRIRCVQRISRRGLSSACIEGMLASAAPYLAVIDADLQHDETLLPDMLELLRTGDADIVIGSRYMQGGSIGDWGSSRAAMSRLATWLSRTLVPVEVTDPMSGFFMLRRDILETTVHKLSTIGFKILLDFFASSSSVLQFRELPYQFRNRKAGESKLDSVATWEYGMLLLDKLIGNIVPVRFVSFSIVGGLGVLVHFFCLAILFKALKTSFVEAQVIGTGVAMTFNFAINNLLTYRDLRLRGWRWLRGLVSFSLACSIGAVANVGIASYLYDTNGGWIFAGLGGVLMGAVWNYVTTMRYTWRKHL
jgi:dolichol-phosphate mannosyltransferase